MFSGGKTTYCDNALKKYESWPKGKYIANKPFLLLHQSIVWLKNG